MPSSDRNTRYRRRDLTYSDAGVFQNVGSCIHTGLAGILAIPGDSTIRGIANVPPAPSRPPAPRNCKRRQRCFDSWRPR
jgi:hypothetical protein